MSGLDRAKGILNQAEATLTDAVGLGHAPTVAAANDVASQRAQLAQAHALISIAESLEQLLKHLERVQAHQEVNR